VSINPTKHISSRLDFQ